MTYTKKQVEQFRRAYPNGSKAVRYLSTPKKGREYEIQNYGEVVGVDREGVLIEWADENKTFVTNAKPGIDRFELVSSTLENTVSLTSLSKPQ